MKSESIEELSKHKLLHPHVKCKKKKKKYKMNCNHFENIFASLCCKLIFIFRLSDVISKGCGYNSTTCVTHPHVLSWALLSQKTSQSCICIQHSYTFICITPDIVLTSSLMQLHNALKMYYKIGGNK